MIPNSFLWDLDPPVNIMILKETVKVFGGVLGVIILLQAGTIWKAGSHEWHQAYFKYLSIFDCIHGTSI